jgi:alpha-glucosidase
MNEIWSWWKHGVIYHIYPRSFYDSNGDGIGDIPGIILKLDYLKELGIDAIWLSPVYKSPMTDFGYDVSDYLAIDPVFGTLDDLKNLIHEAHNKGIKVIMDMILNHTSDQHPWFLESKSSADNPKRDWYIWNTGKNGKKPNNWKSVYGGSAWQYDEQTKMHYLHTFLKEQPDLNWRNKNLRKTFMEIFRYWLDFGVDGFRLDAINMIIKDKKFRDNPAILTGMIWRHKWHTRNQQKSYKIVQKLRKLLDSYEDRMCVGEIYALPPGDSKLSGSYLGTGENSIHLTFDFSLFFRGWSARKYYTTIESWYSCIPAKGWPSHVLSNHDLRRSISRFGSGKKKYKRAKVAAAFLLTLKGTPFIYYGEEIAMQNGNIPRRKIKDPLGRKFWPLYNGRDKARTPMQWSAKTNGGFTTGEPWLPLNQNFSTFNVEKEKKDELSILNFYKTLISIRKSYPALHAGNWRPVIKGENGIIAYFRTSNEQNILVLLNFTGRLKKIPDIGEQILKILVSTHTAQIEITSSQNIALQPYEATIFEVLTENRND